MSLGYPPFGGVSILGCLATNYASLFSLKADKPCDKSRCVGKNLFLISMEKVTRSAGGGKGTIRIGMELS